MGLSIVASFFHSRLGRHRLAWARDGLLIVALVLGWVALDSDRALWTAWWAVALAWLAAALTVWRADYPRLQGRELAGLALFLTPLLVRSLVTIEGPLPGSGIREARELLLVYSVAAALWLAARAQARRALGMWTGAVAFGFLLSLVIKAAALKNASAWASRVSEGIAPSLIVTGLSLLIAVPAWLVAMNRRNAQENSTSSGVNARWLRVVALVAGLVIGWKLYRNQLSLPPALSLPIQAGLEAQQKLWTQSFLMGWGHAAVGRLCEVLLQPRLITLPPWGGPYGLLAMGGALGYGLLVGLGLWQLVDRRGAGAAKVATLMIIGLMLTGGAHAGAVLLALGGWLAIGLGGRKGPVPDAGSDFGPAVVTVAGLAIATVLFFPAWGDSLVGGAVAKPGGQDSYRNRIEFAEGLDPFNAAIPLALAASWRETMNTQSAWSEATYLRVVRLYWRAEELDPYDANTSLQLAQFQLACNRQDEAVQTIQKALARQPQNSDLLDWLFLRAMGQDRSELAYQILEKGLKTAPMQKRWWERRFLLAKKLGQGTLASQSLAVALTAKPEDPELNRAAWDEVHQNGRIPVTP